MSLDLEKLIAQPQANTTIKQATTTQPAIAAAPAVQAQPTQEAAVLPAPISKDTFTPSSQTETNKNNSFLDTVLKYSGVAALVATPVAIFVDHKSVAKALQAAKDDIMSEVGTKISSAVDNIDIAKPMEKWAKANNTNLEKITAGLIGLGTGSILVEKLRDNGKMFANNKVKESNKVETKIVPELSEATEELLESEATKRINGEYSWPTIENPKSWMVTAETQTFMKVGGLAEVAVQLPDEFNKTHKGDESKSMTIVTPLYIGKGKKSADLKDLGDGKFLYTGAEKKQIELTKVSTMPVKVYDDGKKKLKTQEVDVLTGSLNGTKYIFLRNDKMFGITPGKDNNPACSGAYVKNDQGVGETERMAFMSKAVYQLMKDAKEGKAQEIEAPNVMIANDWHASAVSSLMRYDAPVVHEQKGMSDETYEYIKNTPIIHITHNAQYQGDDWQNADKIFRTLFENNTDLINSNIKGYNKEGFPLSKGVGNYNEAYSDLALADRVVAVSNNYAEELCKANDLACGTQTLNNTRKDHGTLLGIINGYTKAISAPSAAMVNGTPDQKTGELTGGINLLLNPEVPFEPYSGLENEEGYAIKQENKSKMIKQLSVMAQKAQNGEGVTTDKNPPKLYKPENCELPADIDSAKVPFIANVGRFVEQKGYDYLVDSMTKVIKNLKPGDEKPIIALLGSGDDPAEIKKLQKFKDDIAKIDEEAAKRIFIFDGFSSGLRDALGVASDFFLIPSKWEPCGLTQMECMPKGSLPIATSTGGLKDTIKNGEDGFLTDVFYGYNDGQLIYDNGKSGLVAPKDNIDAFAVAVKNALDTFYTDPEKIKQMSINAMKRDFSWNVPNGALAQYEELMTTGKVA